MLKRTYLTAAAIATIFSAPVLSNQAQAGDIDASIRDGHLYIYGDDDDSAISITSTSPYTIQITGMATTSGESTTVNGEENGTVVLEGWTRGMFIYNYGGSDHVDMQSLTSAGPVTVDLGTGDDELMLGTTGEAEAFLSEAPIMNASALMLPTSVKLNSYLLVYAGNGHDDVMIRGTEVARTTTIDLGLGDDYFAAGGSTNESTQFGNNTYIIPSNGADEVVIEQVAFQKNVIIDDATGPLMLTVNNTTVEQSAYIYATPDNDDIEAVNFDLGDYLLIITEAGNDRVSYSGSSANAGIYTGVGADMTELYNLETGNLTVQTADGNDRTWLSSSSLNRFDLYGSAGDDYFKIRSTTAAEGYVYGASGTDTVETSTLFPNFVDRYMLYSIEQTNAVLR